MAWEKNDPTKHPRWNGIYDTFYPKYVPFEAPHHTTYSSIEGIWQLEHTRDTLAKYGLKDPWMRNEIWRYPSFVTHRNFFAHFVESFFGPKLQQMKWGFCIAAAYITGENIYYKLRYGKRPCYVNDLLTWLDEYYECHPKFENQ